jgi:hypothetical protein
MVACPGVQHQLQSAHQGEGDDEAGGVAVHGVLCAGRQARAQQCGRQEGAAMRRVVGLVPVGVERELHPQPPDRREQHRETRQGTQARLILERAGELTDRPGEHEVKEQLEPAGAAFIVAVAAGGSQSWRAQPHDGRHEISSSIPSWTVLVAGSRHADHVPQQGRSVVGTEDGLDQDRPACVQAGRAERAGELARGPGAYRERG